MLRTVLCVEFIKHIGHRSSAHVQEANCDSWTSCCRLVYERHKSAQTSQTTIILLSASTYTQLAQLLSLGSHTMSISSSSVSRTATASYTTGDDCGPMPWRIFFF